MNFRFPASFIVGLLIVIFIVLGILNYSLTIQNRTDCKNCNIILISVDTLRADHLGTYGYSKNTSPNIDKWAKKSTVFTNAYTVFPLTFQSFYTLFTGTDTVLKTKSLGYSFSVTDASKRNANTLPQMLKREGYKTAAYVTNPVIDGLAQDMFKNGFDSFKILDKSNLSETINPENAKDLFGPIFENDYENSIGITSQSISWLDKNKNDKFFLWLHYSNPHEPYNPPLNYVCEKTGAECSKTYESVLAGGLPSCETGNTITSEREHQFIDLYDGEIRSVDEQIGKVLQNLEDNKLMNNTIVIFYGDHGESFENGIYRHGFNLNQPNVHIPLVIYYPNAKSGKSNQLVANPDILPTLLSLIKASVPKELNGFNFHNVFKNTKKDVPQRQTVYLMNPIDRNNKYGIIEYGYKYIHAYKDKCIPKNGMLTELYNLNNDPKELNNLYNDDKNMARDFENKINNFFSITKPSTNSDLMEKVKSIGY